MELIGAQLDKYRVVERITQGGMADIYKAYQPDLDRHVAIKVLATDLAQDVEFLKQFEREARLLARLAHPNILPIYDSGTTADGRPYLVMQYHTGGTLADCLGHPQPVWQVVEIVSQIGDALAYAHAHGVVHRDVKPSNILLAESGRPLLADFGLAMILNAPGEAAGTRGYVAPEQRDGKSVDGRADIFSLGVILYELLTGKRFGEQNILTRSMAINHLPPPIITVITCSANWKVANRYDLAEDFVVALQSANVGADHKTREVPTQSQLVLEVLAIVLSIIAGFSLIAYGLTLADVSNKLTMVILGGGCLVDSLLLLFRNRTQRMTTKFLGAIMLMAIGFAGVAFPFGELVRANELSGLARSMLPLAFVPGLISIFVGGRRFVLDQRRARELAHAPVVPKRQVRAISAEVRQIRNAILQTIVLYVGLGGLGIVLARLMPEAIFLPAFISLMGATAIALGIFLSLGLTIWHVYSLVTMDDHSTMIDARILIPNSQVRAARLDKAHQYAARLRQQIDQTRDGSLRDRLRQAARQLDDYVGYIERLTLRLDQLEHDPLIQRDRSTVPRAIDRLEWRLTLEDDHEDERVKDSARQTLAARQLQLDYLSKLEAIMQQTDLYCEQAVAELGTLYSQILLIDAKDIDGARARHVQADIERQVTTLRNAASSLEQIERDRSAVLA